MIKNDQVNSEENKIYSKIGNLIKIVVSIFYKFTLTRMT